MPLFDEQPETIGERAKQYGESTFDYYNRSSRDDIREIRAVLETWFAQYPENGRDDLRSRFRSRTDSQHHAAFFELVIHELIRCLGYSAEAHPYVDGPTHPDFLVDAREKGQFFVEVTTTHDSDEEVAAQRRVEQVYDTLNRFECPDFYLAVVDNGSPASPVPGAQLRRGLREWIRGLSWAEVRVAWERHGFEGVPSFAWRYDGWDVTIKVIPKSEEKRALPGVRPIGLTMPGVATLLNVDARIKDALEAKNKYGPLSFPLLIAINTLGDFCDEYDVMNALFGREAVTFGPDGTRPGGRLRDGVWDGPKGPRFQANSAVWVFRSLRAYSLDSSPFWFVHNPWAARPLPAELLPLTQYVPDAAAGVLRRSDGAGLEGLLGLPKPWPPDKQ